MFDNVNLEKVKSYISFAGKNDIFKDDNTILDLQLKGVASLCKILHSRKYAYLADEVGMGKTYQAIGVISMLQAEKKNARVLIIAPNESIQNNWKTEINNFYKNNILSESVIINEKDVSVVHPVDIIKKHVLEKKDSKIDIVRLTSFSTIANKVAGNVSDYIREDYDISLKKLYIGLSSIIDQKLVGSNEKISFFEAGKIVGSIFRKFSPKYDLVIIDEAQNIRNENNATAFLNYWIGLKRFKNKNEFINNRELYKSEKDSPIINGKFLLLSATPAHRGVESLKKQLLYFEDEKNIPNIDHDYLENFMIRRLRTYKSSNKYSVRNVQAYDVSDGLSVEKRLFLALIQSKLAQIQVENNSIFKIGFLETFESYDASIENNNVNKKNEDKNKEFENGGSTYENEKGSAMDKQMLKCIAKSYGETFKNGKCPPHPKLDYVAEHLGKDISNNLCSCNINGIEKSIIFVRRLATVNELVKNRLNRIYENKIISYWGDRFEIPNVRLEDIQENFQKMYTKAFHGQLADNINRDDYEKALEEDVLDMKSKLISWLSVKESDKNIKYNCISLFKKSIVSNKTNSFLFDENYYRTVHISDTDDEYQIRVNSLIDNNFVKTVSDYINAEEQRYIQKSDKYRKFSRSNLLALCCYVALSREKNSVAINIKSYYRIKEKVAGNKIKLKEKEIIDILLQPSLWNCMQKQLDRPGLLSTWLIKSKDKFCKREAIKSWIEKYIKSSEAILILVYVFCNNKNKKDKNAICYGAWKELNSEDVSYGMRIKMLLDENTAELVCNQLLDKSEIDYEYDTSFMNYQLWVMPAIGGNNNAALIKRFNTPFYPDIIVCTDVLKEGINLHLFCNKVFHYGLAWSPGDLEQRIGRVDRFFSKTHRAIMEGKDAHIDVIYPYMGKTVDEQQLRKVLSFKLSADPLLDSSGLNNKDIELNITDGATVEDLVKYTPKQDEQTNFPYSGEKFWMKE